MTETDGSKEAEQIQIARAIGEELTGAFVAYVRGRVGFDALVFGIHDAMSDLHAVASGDYELAPDDDHEHGHDHEHHHHGHEHHHHGHEYDDEEATEEQEELAQEPARDAGE
jgi:ABC-type Zn2+ transport system substrate-binding protein/surface adhesin